MHRTCTAAVKSAGNRNGIAYSMCLFICVGIFNRNGKAPICEFFSGADAAFIRKQMYAHLILILFECFFFVVGSIVIRIRVREKSSPSKIQSILE